MSITIQKLPPLYGVPTIKHTKICPQTDFVTDGVLTSYLYDGDNVVADIVDGSVVRSYVTPMLDQNVSMTVNDGVDNPVYYYNQDERQSVMNLTDDTGVVVNDYAYSAYGDKVDALTGGDVEQRYTYTGRELSESSGNYYFRYRIYSAGTGSFLSRDPLEYGPDGMSLYNGYFAQKLAIDPFGLLAEDCKLPKIWKKKKGGVIPPADGCSAPKLLAGSPSNPGWFLDCNQKGACDTHDMCYSDCDKSRKDCDKELRKDMLSQCKKCAKKYPNTWWGRRRRWYFMTRCKKWADAYWLGVRAGGGGPYKARQEKNCECACITGTTIGVNP